LINERVRQESCRSLLDTPLDAAINVDVITDFKIADDTIPLARFRGPSRL
jgi:hypothetical protein